MWCDVRQTKPWLERRRHFGQTWIENWCRIPWHYGTEGDTVIMMSPADMPSAQTRETKCYSWRCHTPRPRNNSNNFKKKLQSKRGEIFRSSDPSPVSWSGVLRARLLGAGDMLWQHWDWPPWARCWFLPPGHRGERWSSPSLQITDPSLQDFLMFRHYI